ncbi:MAG: hypothetical protein M3O22_05570 [Pseudomonadota bacterium]|nr:hypothetical protein [Pseudomonadota bacterium]
MKQYVAGWKRRWASLSDCGKVVTLVLAIGVLVWVQGQARLVFRDKPSQAEVVKLLTLRDDYSQGLQYRFNKAFPKGSDIRDVLAYMDQYADQSVRYETLDYPWLGAWWAYWPTLVTGSLQHTKYVKYPAPSDLPAITWVAEFTTRRGRLVEARFTPHAPEEKFLVWARMQNWGEVRREVLWERFKEIKNLNPSIRDVRLLAEYLGAEDPLISRTANPESTDTNQRSEYLSLKFYYFPHNREIIFYNHAHIQLNVHFDQQGECVWVSGGPGPKEFGEFLSLLFGATIGHLS